MVKNTQSSLSPPMVLAIAYAPSALRPRLQWLLAFDARLQSVLQRASEPMIAQLRLSWWRDGLNAPFEKRPKGEPLLAELGHIGYDENLQAAALHLVDAYEILALSTADDHHLDGQSQRISAIVNAYAVWSACAANVRDPIIAWWSGATSVIPQSLPRILRPLTILALAEQLQRPEAKPALFGHGARLICHALTGR